MYSAFGGRRAQRDPVRDEQDARPDGRAGSGAGPVGGGANRPTPADPGGTGGRTERVTTFYLLLIGPLCPILSAPPRQGFFSQSSSAARLTRRPCVLVFTSARSWSRWSRRPSGSAPSRVEGPPQSRWITATISDGGRDNGAPAEPPKPKSLYERLGGKEGISKVVNAFLKNLVSNDVVKSASRSSPKSGSRSSGPT